MVYFCIFLLLCSQGWVMKCTPIHDQQSPHKTVTHCIFTLTSRVAHDTSSNRGDTSCECKRYKCIYDKDIRVYIWSAQSFACLILNLPGHRADLKMLSAHIYLHSHLCYYVYLITDKLSTTTLYLVTLSSILKWIWQNLEGYIEDGTPLIWATKVWSDQRERCRHEPGKQCAQPIFNH